MPAHKVFVDTRLLIPTKDLLGAGASSLLDLPRTADMQAALDEMVARGLARVVTEYEMVGYAPTKRFLKKLVTAEPRFAAILLQEASTPDRRPASEPVVGLQAEEEPESHDALPPDLQEHFTTASVTNRAHAVALLAASLDAVNAWLLPDRLPEFVFRLGIAAAAGNLNPSRIEEVINALVNRSEPHGPHLRQPPVAVQTEEEAALFFLRAIQVELVAHLGMEAPLLQGALALLEAALLIFDATDLPVDRFLAQCRRVRTPEQLALVQQLRPLTGVRTQLPRVH